MPIASAEPAAIAPIDLADPRARWIEIRFEVSPAEAPGSLDHRWSAARRARFESRPESGEVLIRVPSSELEAHLRAEGRDPVEGSFTDFVWRLDPGSGHVRRAHFTGKVRESIQLGPFEMTAPIEIRTDVTTEQGAGFRYGKGVLGIPTPHYCQPGEAAQDCVAVPPIRFDRQRGYVNAVGVVRAVHALTVVEAFSPLGEVLFQESTRETETVVSGPRPTEALCSQGVGRACATDGGDT